MAKAKIVDNLKLWIKENRLEFVLLLAILAIGAFFRLYRLPEYMTFLGDEGRDAILVRRLLVERDIILIGPGTSIGNMYLGPMYYYFIAPFLLLFGFSPAGPSYGIAIFGILTIFLVWLVGREFFLRKEGRIGLAGLMAAFLYAISPTVIIYSRSSWNPNIMPFVSLLSIYAIWRVWNKGEYRWLLALAVSFAFVLQSHYLGLLLGATLGVFWFVSLKKYKRDKGFWKYSIVGVLIFLLLMSPLAIFDMRHGFINFNALKTFFLERQTTVSARPWNALPEAWPLWEEISTRLVGGRSEIAGSWVALASLVSLFWIKKRKGYAVIFMWIGFSLLGLGLYKQEVYDHYYGFFFAAPFLLTGAVLQEVVEKAKLRGWWIAASALVLLAYFSLLNSPLAFGPNRQLQRSETVAGKISEDAGGANFNLAVIAERNYEDAYQYFLEQWGTGVIDIDALRADETITDTLYVVCELPREKCDPTHSPKAEVANFGWSQIDKEWDIMGVVLYKLIHVEGN